MARPRTPTKLLDARGAFRKHPERRRDGEPEVKNALGAAPYMLNEQEMACWNEIVSYAPVGVLTEADRHAVELAACLLAEFRADRAGFAAGKMGRLQSMLGQFGMNPADRSRLNIEKPSSDNPFDDLDS